MPSIWSRNRAWKVWLEISQGSFLLTRDVLNQLVCGEIKREPAMDIFSVHLICLCHLGEDLRDCRRVVKGQPCFAHAHAVLWELQIAEENNVRQAGRQSKLVGKLARVRKQARESSSSYNLRGTTCRMIARTLAAWRHGAAIAHQRAWILKWQVKQNKCLKALISERITTKETK